MGHMKFNFLQGGSQTLKSHILKDWNFVFKKKYFPAVYKQNCMCKKDSYQTLHGCM